MFFCCAGNEQKAEVEEVQPAAERAKTCRDPTFEHRHEAKYHREVGSHAVQVMANPSDYVYAFLPHGEYHLSQMVLYPDVHPRPAHVVIKNFTWLPAPKTGGHGMLTLPDFDGHLPTQVATPSFLSWYGCSFADGDKARVKLKVDHEIMDFNYNHYRSKWVMDQRYGPGGLGLERHEFIHLECALTHFDESGHLLIGKINEEEKELYLTAFKIPQYHTVYLAPFAIHSNDHLKGTWRTMLSTFSEAETAAGLNYIDHCLLKDSAGSGIELKFSSSLDSAAFLDDEGATVKHTKIESIQNKVSAAVAIASKKVGDIHGKVWEIEDGISDKYAALVRNLGHGPACNRKGVVVPDESYCLEDEIKSRKCPSSGA